MKLICTLFVLGMLLQTGVAQTRYFTDSLQLRSGTWVVGRVHLLRRGGKVLLENTAGSIQSFKANDLRQLLVHSLEKPGKKGDVRSKEKPAKVPCERPYAFRERGWYGITYAGTINGISHSGEDQLGLSIQQVTGFQFNRMLGAGIGVGLENFSVGSANGPLVLPVYAEARGYWLPKTSTPYYALSGGYGFAFKNLEQGILAAEGGFMWRPSLGFRLGAKDGANFLFDLGYQFQNLTLKKGFNNREFQIQDIQYKRFSVRVGFVF
jgi:hypothetical protein